MSGIRIYQFTKYDIATDNVVKSRRWGTLAAIEWLGGTALEDTGVDVEASAIGRQIEGLSDIGFDPHAQKGFQKQAR